MSATRSACVLAILACFPGADPGLLAQGKTTSTGLWIDNRLTDMPNLPLGPFVRLADGTILTVDGQNTLTSRDEGRAWESRPMFVNPTEFAISNERALIRTRAGALIVAFANLKEKSEFRWDNAISDMPGAKLPTCAVRSLDEGRTWERPQKLHDEWTGAIRDMIQTTSGRVVFTSMMMLHQPGRHSVVTYSSADDGKSWRRSNIIDLGGIGHHGGVTEGTLEELHDGRLWLLMRTNWKTFWEAFSEDNGVSWRVIRPSWIDASSAPGQLSRLASGRIVLFWNRYFPEGQTSFPLSGGDNQWSEVQVSNHRLELSLALSDDDGRTWTRLAVIARIKKGSLAYPYVFEARPGELWVTSMQGGLRARLREEDFAGETRKYARRSKSG